MTAERFRTVLLIAAALVALGLFYWLSSSIGFLRPESGLREKVAAAGPAGPLLLVGAMVVAAVVVFIPNSLVAAAGGALFGFPVGFASAVAGQGLGAVISYGIAQGAGRAPLRWALGGAVDQVAEFWKRHGFAGILLLRLLPFASFDAVSYASGAVGVPLRTFALATLLGMLPSTAAMTALGDFLLGWEGALYLITGAAVVLMFALPLLRRKK